jgi:hypothetical protein
MEEIEKNRIDCDPVYHLLFCPKDYIDQFLEIGFKLILKRYGTVVSEDATILRTIKMIQDKKYDNDDLEIKIAILFFIISREPALATKLEQLYNINGGIFENQGPQMFRKLMVSVKEFIRKTLEFPYNKHNIVETISNFNKALRTTYAIGEVTNLQ